MTQPAPSGRALRVNLRALPRLAPPACALVLIALGRVSVHRASPWFSRRLVVLRPLGSHRPAGLMWHRSRRHRAVVVQWAPLGVVTDAAHAPSAPVAVS